MKTLYVCVVISALAAPELALAETSFDPAQLGRMQAVLNTCSRVSPQQASKYLLQIKALIGDATKDTVDQATRSEEYQQAYHAVTDELGSLEKEEMTRACTRYLAAAN